MYKKSWKFILISQIFVLASCVMMILIPSEVQNLINNGVLLGEDGRDVIINSSLRIMLFAFLYAVFMLLSIMMAVAFAEGTGNYIRTRAFEKIEAYSFKNFDQYPTGELMSRLTNDIYQINIAVQLSMRFLLAAPFTIIIAVIAVLVFSPDLAWIFLIAIPLMAIVLAVVAIKLQKQYKERQKKLDDMNNVLQEDFSGIRVTKAFMRQDYENQRYDGVNQSYRKAAEKPMRTQYWILPSMFGVIGISTALALWVGGPAAIDDPAAVGQLVAFSQYLLMILVQMFNLAILLPQLSSADISAGRINDTIKTEPTVKDPPEPRIVDPATIKGRVVFENVSFSYAGPGSKETVKNINLVAEPGQIVAFLGSTGCGKSTIVNLLPRFYDVTSGRITIDGIDVREFPQQLLRQIVVPVMQESILFSGDLRQNIKMGMPEATDDEMEASSKAADAHDFIMSNQEGYDRHVSRKGANFSGGQRQRICIARGVCANPRVLIMDDSTSAVDVTTESRIQGELKKILANTTNFIVAQRISTVLLADKIVLLENGEIVAEGNHDELMGSSPLYQEIFNSQLGGLRPEDYQ